MLDDHDEGPAPLSVRREQAPCLCMTCWGETDQTTCTIDPRNAARNRAMLTTTE